MIALRTFVIDYPVTSVLSLHCLVFTPTLFASANAVLNEEKLLAAPSAGPAQDRAALPEIEV